MSTIQKPKLSNLAIAELILAGIFVFVVCFTVLLCVSGYLAGYKSAQNIAGESLDITETRIISLNKKLISDCKHNENTPVNISDWKSYESLKTNFSISAPINAIVSLDIDPLDTPSKDESVNLFTIKDASGQGNTMRVDIESWTSYINMDEPPKEFTFQESINKEIEFFRSNSDSMLKKEDFVLDNSPATKVTFEYKNSMTEEREKRIVVYAEKGNRKYSISAFIRGNEACSYVLIFEKMLATFKFIVPKTSCGQNVGNTQNDRFASYLSDNPDIVMSNDKLIDYFSKNLDTMIFTGISRGKLDKYSDSGIVVLFFKPKDETGDNPLPVPVTIFIIQEGEKGKWQVIERETSSEPKQIIGSMRGFELIDNKPKQIVKKEPQFFIGAYDPIVTGTCASVATSFNIYRIEKGNFKLIWNIVNSVTDYGDSSDIGYGGKGNTTSLDTSIKLKDVDGDGNLEIVRSGTEQISSGGCGESDPKQISDKKIYETYKWNAQKQTFVITK